MADKKTHDELTADLDAKKVELKEKRAELEAFEKEKGLKRGKDHSEDEKSGKKWKRLKGEVDALAAQRNTLADAVKDSKPKKEKVDRPSKYEYPADCTTADLKKKFRAAQRTAAKKKDKPEKVKVEKAEKTEKVEKKGDKAEKAPEGKKKKDKSKSED